eukprot:7487482-Lingulodinium_polyedra.AAC.1
MGRAARDQCSDARPDIVWCRHETWRKVAERPWSAPDALRRVRCRGGLAPRRSLQAWATAGHHCR